MHPRRFRCLIAVLVVGAAYVAAALPAAGAPSAADSASEFNATASAQIAALQGIKESLTPAEQKLDSGLAVTQRLAADPRTARAVPDVHTGVVTSPAGRTEVDISVTAVSAGVLARLRAVGAIIGYASAREATIRAAVPVAALDRIAAWGDVRRVSVASGFQMADVAAPTPPTLDPARLSAALATVSAGAVGTGFAAPAAAATTPPQGSVVSQGDQAHAADVARARTGVTGIGVKVCVLSDGVDSLAQAQATGDLPAVDVLPGQSGDGDEGTAILEIVHDLAPGASLGFATAEPSDAAFADNIRALRTTAKCRIILDDVEYYDEDPFQDGPIAQAVNAVIASGALYFSSAGNDGNTIDGTSGTYQGNFVDSGRGAGKMKGTAADFEPGSGVQIYEPVSDASVGDTATLFWADPLGHARDDYDLYNLDAHGNVVAFSQNVQTGTQDPYEHVLVSADSGNRLVVVKYRGADRYFQLSVSRGRFRTAGALRAYATPGSIRGHSAVAQAFSVAAAPAAAALPVDLEPGDPPNPSGPFPHAFTAAQKPERFTSDGPVQIFFAANGTPDRQVRQKPDITAADGVRTTIADLNPFFGTSAAVAHAAAIAALVVSGNPGATTATVRRAFDATALDLTPAGVDGRTGHGLLRADRVLAYTGATPRPLVAAGRLSVQPTTGDGDRYLEPGETGRLSVPLVDVGDGAATNVTVTVTSTDPLVTISPATEAYGTIAHGATKTQTFAVHLAAKYPLGKTATFTEHITFAGVLSPVTARVELATGQPATTVRTFAYAGAPVKIPDNAPAGVSVPIRVAGIGYASNLTFSIDGSRCTTAARATTVGLDHTFVGDLVATLRAPAGATVQLFAHAGSTGNNLCRVVFTDGARRGLATATAAQAPFTGSWLPVQPLSALRSAPVDGTWRFTAVDTAPGDTGSVRAVSLHIAGFVK